MTNTITFKWNTGNIEIAACAVLDMTAAYLARLVKTATVNSDEVKADLSAYIQSEIDKLNPKRDYDKRTIEQYKKLLSVVAEKKQSKREKAVIRIAKNCSSAMAGKYYGIIHDAEKYYVLDGYRMVRYATPIDGLEDAPCTFDTVKAIGNKSAYSAALVLPTVQEIKADMKIAKLAGTDINHIRVIKTDKRLDCCYDFGYGLPMVNAKYLIDMIEALPDAQAYYNPEHALCNPIYFTDGENDGILLPIRKMQEYESAPTVEEKAVETAVENPIEKPVEAAAPVVKEDPAPVVNEVKEAPEVKDNKPSAVKINQITAALENRQVYGYKPDGNTVVAHRWKVFHLSGNLYLQEPQVDQYKQRFAHLALFFPGVKIGLDIGMLTGWQLDQYSAEDVEKKCGCPTVETFSAMISEQMENDKHIRNTYIAFIKQYDSELAQRMEVYKSDYMKRREKKEAERQAEYMKKQEQARLAREQETAMEIEQAEQAIINGGTIDNAMLDGMCIFLRLFDKYDIDIAIRTRGWIINKLTSVIQKENGGALLTFRRKTKTEKVSRSFVVAYFKLRDMLIKAKQKAEAASVDTVDTVDTAEAEQAAAEKRVEAVAEAVKVNDMDDNKSGVVLRLFKRGFITEDEAKQTLLFPVSVRISTALALPAHEEAVQDTAAPKTIQIAAVIHPAVLRPSARHYRQLFARRRLSARRTIRVYHTELDSTTHVSIMNNAFCLNSS